MAVMFINEKADESDIGLGLNCTCNTKLSMEKYSESVKCTCGFFATFAMCKPILWAKLNSFEGKLY